MSKPRLRIIKRDRFQIVAQLTLPSGRFIRFYARDEDHAKSRADSFLNGAQYDDSYNRYTARNKKKKVVTYKDLRKKTRENTAANIEDTKRFLDGVSACAAKALLTAHITSENRAAQAALKSVMREAEFNEYTGNLYNSYRATIVSNGEVVDYIYPDKPHMGKVHHTRKTKKGRGINRYSPIMKRRHPVPLREPRLVLNVKRRNNMPKGLNNRKIVRYLKRYEKNPSEKGYNELGVKTPGGGAKLRIGYLQPGAGGGIIRSGVILENTAPYADAVHVRHNVLKKSLAKRVYNKEYAGGKGANLLRVLTKRTLKEAGYDIK